MTGMQKRVLIVDDEEDLTWTLARKLSKDQDKFQLITVNSGREAKEVLSQLPVDLVITDVRMPEVSGLELLEEIKNNGYVLIPGRYVGIKLEEDEIPFEEKMKEYSTQLAELLKEEEKLSKKIKEVFKALGWEV